MCNLVLVATKCPPQNNFAAFGPSCVTQHEIRITWNKKSMHAEKILRTLINKLLTDLETSLSRYKGKETAKRLLFPARQSIMGRIRQDAQLDQANLQRIWIVSQYAQQFGLCDCRFEPIKTAYQQDSTALGGEISHIFTIKYFCVVSLLSCQPHSFPQLGHSKTRENSPW